MNRDDYYREAFEVSMDEAGCWHLVEQMTTEQRAEVGAGIAGSAENEGTAFYRPESPLIGENDRLKRKLRWERELTGCPTCGGDGRLSYNAGPWAVNTGCDVCHGAGKVHPHGEREPS